MLVTDTVYSVGFGGQLPVSATPQKAVTEFICQPKMYTPTFTKYYYYSQVPSSAVWLRSQLCSQGHIVHSGSLLIILIFEQIVGDNQDERWEFMVCSEKQMK